jgi:hypothetical protein
LHLEILSLKFLLFYRKLIGYFEIIHPIVTA